MPRIFKIGSYSVYFWSNEHIPLEPIHVHISQGRAVPNATKVWITQNGKCILSNNASQIPEHILRDIMRVIESRSGEIIEKWAIYKFKIARRKGCVESATISRIVTLIVAK